MAAGGPVLETTFNSPFGATQYTPDHLAALGLQLCPDPASASRSTSTCPPPGFNERIYAYNHPGKHLKNYLTIRGPAATGLFTDQGSRAS